MNVLKRVRFPYGDLQQHNNQQPTTNSPNTESNHIMNYAVFASLLVFAGCLPEQAYPNSSYSPSSYTNSGGTLAGVEPTPAFNAHPSGTPVPSPEREERFPAFESFYGVDNIYGSGWNCLSSPLGDGTTYSSCLRDNRVCESFRSSFIDRGEDVGRCAPATEAWCYAYTHGINNNRYASCSLTYDGCASNRDSTVRGNRGRVYPHRDITRCRAFR